MAHQTLGSASAVGAGLIARLDRLPLSRWHLGVFVICGLALFFDAMDQIIPSSAAPGLVEEWGLSRVDVGVIFSAGSLGSVLGAIVFGVLADRVGRRMVFSLTVLLFSVMTAICALAQNLPQLLIMRVLVGMGLGGLVPVSTVYFTEYIPPAWRGRLLSWVDGWFGMGVFAAFAVGAVVIVPFGWRWGFVIGVIPAIVAFIAFRSLPESVRHLISRNKLAEATQAVESVERRVLGNTTAVVAPVAPVEVAHAAPVTEASVSRTAAFRALLRPGMRGTSAALVALWFFPTFFAVTQFYPLLLTSELHIDTATALQYLTIATAPGILGQIVAGLMADHWGRKVAVAAFVLLYGFAPLMVFNLSNGPLTAVLLLGIAYFATAGMYGALWAYSPEQIPTLIRASGFGLIIAIWRLAGTLGPTLVGSIYQYIGIQPVLWLLAAGAVLCTVILLLFGRETNRQTLETVAERMLAEEQPVVAGT